MCRGSCERGARRRQNEPYAAGTKQGEACSTHELTGGARLLQAAHLQFATALCSSPSSGGDGTSPRTCETTICMEQENGRSPVGTLHIEAAMAGACANPRMAPLGSSATGIEASRVHVAQENPFGLAGALKTAILSQRVHSAQDRILHGADTALKDSIFQSANTASTLIWCAPEGARRAHVPRGLGPAHVPMCTSQTDRQFREPDPAHSNTCQPAPM
jgi:hypothetical protein